MVDRLARTAVLAILRAGMADPRLSHWQPQPEPRVPATTVGRAR